MLRTFLQSFSFIPFIAFDDIIFEYYFAILSFRCHGNRSISAVWTKFICLVEDYSRISSHLSPLTSEVVGAPQMTLQQYLSTRPLPSVSKPHSRSFFDVIFSSSVFLFFLPLSLSPAELSSPCPRILRCGHTIWVSVSLPRLGDHHALQFFFFFFFFFFLFVVFFRLRSKRDVLVPPYDLQSRKSCCCLGYPGKNLGFWSFLGDDCSKILEVLHFF